LNNIVYMALVFIGVSIYILLKFNTSLENVRMIKRIVNKIKNIFRKKYHEE